MTRDDAEQRAREAYAAGSAKWVRSHGAGLNECLIAAIADAIEAATASERAAVCAYLRDASACRSVECLSAATAIESGGHR